MEVDINCILDYNEKYHCVELTFEIKSKNTVFGKGRDIYFSIDESIPLTTCGAIAAMDKNKIKNLSNTIVKKCEHMVNNQCVIAIVYEIIKESGHYFNDKGITPMSLVNEHFKKNITLFSNVITHLSFDNYFNTSENVQITNMLNRLYSCLEELKCRSF